MATSQMPYINISGVGCRLSGEFKNIFKVASMYMATIIGAGFASGQEIVQFFTMYYKGGFYGILFAGFLFSLIGCIVLGKVYRERIANYDEFMFPAMGWLVGLIMEIVVTLFMLCVFGIMIAGMSNIAAQSLSIPYGYTVVPVAIVCMLIIMCDIKGIVALSSVITPILIIGILFAGFYIIVFRDTPVFNVVGNLYHVTHNWFFSSLLYVSYNSIMSVMVMCSLLPYLKTGRTAWAGGILGGAMLCFIALVLNSAIYMFYPGTSTREIPILSIAEKYSGLLSWFYTFILWLAMLISAVTAGYCFVDRIGKKIHINHKVLIIIVCTLAVPLSSFGFSGLIAAIYPVFGYIGLFMVFNILFQGVGKFHL